MLTTVTKPAAPIPTPPALPPSPASPPTRRGGRAKGQAVSPRTPEQYDRLVAAYLRNPGNHSAVAVEVGCTRDTAKQAFDHGWSKRVSGPGQPAVYEQLEWAPAIKSVLAEHQALARAKLEQRRMQDAESEQARAKTLAHASAQARADLIDSRALLGRSIKQARANAILLMTVTSNLLGGALELSKRMRALIADPNVKLTPQEMAVILRQIGTITRDANDAARAADDMERRALGEPDQVISVEGNMTEADAAKLLREAWESLRIAGHAPDGSEQPMIEGTVVEGAKG